MGVEIISHYFPDLSPAQLNQFQQLAPLYLDWNAKINVISRKDTEDLYTKHVLHSLGIAKIASFSPGTKVLDVGTGGGFPGIPLAILFPGSQFHLVDSIGKKIVVVKNIAESLGLKNVTAEKIRAEEITQQYDFVVSRAVTRMSEFYRWVKTKIRPESVHKTTSSASFVQNNGILCLKGGDLEEELSEARAKYKIYNLSDCFEEAFFETKKVVYIPL